MRHRLTILLSKWTSFLASTHQQNNGVLITRTSFFYPTVLLTEIINQEQYRGSEKVVFETPEVGGVFGEPPVLRMEHLGRHGFTME